MHADNQSLLYLAKSYQVFDNNSALDGWVTRCNTTLRSSMSMALPMRSPKCSLLGLRVRPTRASSALVHNASRFLSKLRYSYLLDIHAVATLAKLDTGRHVKRQGVENAIIWFQMKCGLCRLHVSATHRTDTLRRIGSYIGGVRWGEYECGEVSRAFGWPRMRATTEG